MTDRYEETLDGLAHEVWAAAQLAQGEGVVDGVARIAALLRKGPHPAITHCDKCGCDWLDNGLNPVGCPYCKPSAETEASRRTPTKEVDLFTPAHVWRWSLSACCWTRAMTPRSPRWEPVDHP